VSTGTSRRANGGKVGLLLGGEPEGDTKVITYADLEREVNRCANALAELGVVAGDRVAYLNADDPGDGVRDAGVREVGRPGTRWSFAGSPRTPWSGRIRTVDCKIVITADGGYRRGSASALKPNVDCCRRIVPGRAECAGGTPYRTGRCLERQPRRMVARSVDRQSEEHDAQPHDAEEPASNICTPRARREAEGHPDTTGGYLTHVAYTHSAVFALKTGHRRLRCAADIRLGHRHSYIVYRAAGQRCHLR